MKRSKGKTASQKTPQIRVAKKIYYKHSFKTLFSALGYVILVSFVVYLCFAATIIRVLPSYDNDKVHFTPVKNMTYKGGIVPPGEIIVVNTKSEQKDDVFSHLGQAFSLNDGLAEVKVVAGPTGRIVWTPKLITVDGQPVDVTISEKPKDEFLKDEYLVKCLSGCQDGFIISKKNIYGQPL